MNYPAHLLVLISLYTILAISLNLITGYLGLVSLGHAAFYGIGAYIAGLLMVDLGWNFWTAFGAAMISSLVLGIVVGVPSLRLRGDFFVLATLGLQAIVLSILFNWSSVTHGPLGVSNIPAPSLLGYDLDTPLRYCALAAVLAAIALGFTFRIVHSPFGRVLKAIRDDELAVTALGKNVAAIKLVTFTISAALAGMAGALYAGYFRFVDPSSFTISESVLVLAIIIVGGAGTFLGPIIGAALLVVLPEVLRFLYAPDWIAPNLRLIIFGALLIVVVRFHPKGITGGYDLH
jgi:branched-chain amino acid transport system permease protein